MRQKWRKGKRNKKELRNEERRQKGEKDAHSHNKEWRRKIKSVTRKETKMKKWKGKYERMTNNRKRQEGNKYVYTVT